MTRRESAGAEPKRTSLGFQEPRADTTKIGEKEKSGYLAAAALSLRPGAFDLVDTRGPKRDCSNVMLGSYVCGQEAGRS